jgi:hypothetical protein
MLKGPQDKEGVERLRVELRKSDTHVILARLVAAELAAVEPLLRERGNFSIVVDDWWSMPHWFLDAADYILFRNYNGIAFRLGMAPFLEDGPGPPLIMVPPPPIATYTVMATLLRVPAVVTSPLVDLMNRLRTPRMAATPERYIYFPFPVDAKDVPLQKEELKYDFANTGGTCGIWLMRDPAVSFRYTFANLYYDRQVLTDGIAALQGKPFSIYDCRVEPKQLPYPEYMLKNRQSRYLIATGGLQNTSVPKYLEYACAGTPMIGRALPFEWPWLDDCLFPVDAMRLRSGQLKPLLEEALARYPVLRDNCLKWRDRLLEQYSIHRLLDLVQAQADGEPIPPEYLKGAARERSLRSRAASQKRAG